MTERPLRTKEIAYELAISERTVRRLYAQKLLPGAYKLAGRTSPIMMPRNAALEIKRGQQK